MRKKGRLFSDFYLFKKISSMTLRSKLNIVLVLFVVVPALFLASRLLAFYTDNMVKATSQNVHSIVKRSNQLIDVELSRIEDASYIMLSNQKFYNVFSNLDKMNTSEVMTSGRIITEEFGKQFATIPQVYQAMFYSPNWIFGQDSRQITLSPEQVKESKFPTLSYEAKGSAKWIGGYDFGKYFNYLYLKSRKNYEYQYPITMIRMMNFQYFENGIRYVLPQDEEPPILMIFLLEKDLRQMYDHSVSYNNVETFILNKEGVVVSSNSERFPIASEGPSEVQDLVGQSGYIQGLFQGEDTLLCYDTIKTTGWLTVTAVPMNALLKDMRNEITVVLTRLFLVMLIISGTIAILLSNSITKPIAMLVHSAHRIARGDFSGDTPVPLGGDFETLAKSFNHMEKEIRRLIEENYIISLREKDTQIMALNLQINPHFLYNTLNTINMLAIQNGDETTSDLIVSLSEMLQYSFKNPKEKIPLIDEIRWTQNYLRIMSARFQGGLDVEIDIAGELFDYKVPKFFLQPLVENSVIHGFEDIESGGIIRIHGEKKDDSLYFIISDNGKGMKPEEVENSVFLASRDSGIGISNIHRRLMLIYGEAYQVHVESELGKGTSFYLTIPCEL